MDKSCRRCGDEFHTKYHWAEYCYECYKDRKKLLEQFDDGCLSVEIANNMRRHIENLGAKLQRRRLSPDPSPTIPPVMLRRLIQLSHPDKHNGSETSQTATQWLLEQREAHH